MVLLLSDARAEAHGEDRIASLKPLPNPCLCVLAYHHPKPLPLFHENLLQSVDMYKRNIEKRPCKQRKTNVVMWYSQKRPFALRGHVEYQGWEGGI